MDGVGLPQRQALLKRCTERKKHRGEPSNLVSQALCLYVCYILANALVCVEVEGELLVVLLDENTRSALDGFCPDTTLHKPVGFIA